LGKDRNAVFDAGFNFPSVSKVDSTSHVRRSVSELVDPGASPSAELFTELLVSGDNIPRNKPENLQLSWRRILSATLDRKPEMGPAPRFARFLSDMLGKETKVLSGGGLKLESRQYQVGDEFKDLDWNAYARTDSLHTKIPNEQKINPLHCVIDADWLGEGATFDTLPKNLQYLMTLLALGAKERVPLNLHLYWRGEKILSFAGKDPEHNLNGMFKPQNQEIALNTLWRLWRIAAGVNQAKATEAAQGVVYPPTRIMREAWAPPKPSTIAPLIAISNLQTSAGLLTAIAKR
jgi:hypothetical protein